MTASRGNPPTPFPRQVFPVMPRETTGNATDRSATQPRRGEAPYLGPETSAAAQPRSCPSGDAEPVGLPPPAGTRRCPSRSRRLCLSAGRPGRAHRRRRDTASPAPPAGAMSGAPRGRGRREPRTGRAFRCPAARAGGGDEDAPGARGGRAGGAPARARKARARARQAGPPPPPPRRARAAPGTAASSSRAQRGAPPSPAAAAHYPGPLARLRRGVTRPRLTPALSLPPPRPRVFSPHSSLGAILHSTPCSQSPRCPSLARARLPSPARAQDLGPPRALKGPGHGGARGGCGRWRAPCGEGRAAAGTPERGGDTEGQGQRQSPRSRDTRDAASTAWRWSDAGREAPRGRPAPSRHAGAALPPSPRSSWGEASSRARVGPHPGARAPREGR